MELREFKRWLIDKGLEDDELYQESIKCYQVEAYRAAYLYSYLANHKYIANLALDYKAIPKNFMANCPEDDARVEKWQNIVEQLKNEDVWETTVTDKLIKVNGDNIFKLPPKIKDKYEHMKVLRNNSAHAKDRKISESTVLELWNDIEYIYPYFVINGTRDAWLDSLDRVSRYTNNSDYLDELLDEFSKFSKEIKIDIIKDILERYLMSANWSEPTPALVCGFLIEVIFEDQLYSIISSELTVKQKIYWSIVVENENLFNLEPIEMFSEFELLLKADDNFVCFCSVFEDGFWLLVNYFSEHLSDSVLPMLIFGFLERYPEFWSKSNYQNSEFLSNNRNFFYKVLEKVEELYYYRTSYTTKSNSTQTFDYSNFGHYKSYIRYLLYRISMDSSLKVEPRVSDFIQRCKKLISDDYSREDFHPYRRMQNFLQDIQSDFIVLQ